MKIHHFDGKYAEKNGIDGLKEIILAVIIGVFGTITPAILAPSGVISYAMMFIIILISVVIVAILLKKIGHINKASMSVLIEENGDLYYMMITPNLRGSMLPKSVTSLIAGPSATFAENKISAEIIAENLATDDNLIKELFNLYKENKIKTTLDTIMYGKPIYVSKIIEKDFKLNYRKKYKVKCIKNNSKKHSKVIIPRVFPTFFNN